MYKCGGMKSGLAVPGVRLPQVERSFGTISHATECQSETLRRYDDRCRRPGRSAGRVGVVKLPPNAGSDVANTSGEHWNVS